MYTTQAEYCTRLRELIDRKPDRILIGTYGLYAGISSEGIDVAEKWGNKYKSETKDILDSMEGMNVEILVGLSEYFSCTKDFPCKHCELKYVNGLIRLLEHGNKWFDFKFRFLTNFHLKCFITIKDSEICGVGGGRNFTSSDWVDVSMDLNKSQILRTLELWRDSWKSATVLNKDNIQTYIDRIFPT